MENMFILIVSLCMLHCVHSISIEEQTNEVVHPPQMSQNTVNKIVGGEDAADGQAPYHTRPLQREDRSHFCGGAILSPSWIVTASHCVDSVSTNPKSILILVGTNNLKKGGTYYRASKIFMHEEYNSPLHSNDIALIRVDGKISFNDRVKQIGYDPIYVSPNTLLQLTGWGIQASGSLPQMLQVIHLRSISHEECVNLWGEHLIDWGHLCTLNKIGEGACSGDSGGPAVLNNTIVGVVNFGRRCARGKPDVFARVAYYHGWIQTTIANNTPLSSELKY